MEIDQWTQRTETPKDLTGTSTLSRTYAATLAEIITKSNVGRQQLDPKQTLQVVWIFYEVVSGVVPAHRLNDCYLEALRTRANTFPLKPEELCAAWETIKRAEHYKRAPESRQITHGLCELCFNTNTETIRNDRGVIIGARPCKH